MRSEHVGTLVVVQQLPSGLRPVAILTDRDIVVEGVAKRLEELESLCVGDIASRSLVTVGQDWDLDHALETLSRAGIRRAPVVDEEGILVGILAVDDLLESFASRFVAFVGVISRELRNEQQCRA